MISAEKLQLYFKIFRGLSLVDLQSIYHLVQKRQLAVGEIFIQTDSLQRKMAYIRKGLIRAYTINEKGDEITMMLRWEDQFVASPDAIIRDQPSRYQYEALEPTELLQIDYDGLQEVLKKNPSYEQVRRHFLLKMLGESLDKVESFILLNPEERYLEFINKKTDIVNRVPDKYIAHILGITPVSLSRIRRRIAGRSIN
ncbi:MAG: Crp/Fnr family transcriptional regulator [Saprospiraceae bacterium]|nr:Crp/Fnr family transcriptional regulator [Saprospiraceae bacterium]